MVRISLVKLLGVMDILASLLLVLIAFNIKLSLFVMIFAVYLLVKTLFFFHSFVSAFDFVAGTLLVLSLFFVLPKILLWIAALLLAQKGFFSLFA